MLIKLYKGADRMIKQTTVLAALQLVSIFFRKLILLSLHMPYAYSAKTDKNSKLYTRTNKMIKTV